MFADLILNLLQPWRAAAKEAERKAKEKAEKKAKDEAFCFGIIFAILFIACAVLFAGFLHDVTRSDPCQLKECCRDDWIDFRISELHENLEHQLIGQHLAKRIIPQTIRAHIKKENPSKALVLSFHGWTGSGKNYVADIIARHVYKEGVKSQYVHRFIAGYHFPHSSQLEEYKKELQASIRYETLKCNRSMFVFDEIEKMPPGLTDVLKPFLDHNPNVDGVDYRKNIFIFLSNTAGDLINQEILRHFKSGNPREDITAKQMEKILSHSAFNIPGGLKDANIIKNALVDFFVPFLPMEKHHVKDCVRAEMRRRRKTVMQPLVDAVADELEYFPRDEPLFSETGCKRVAKKLDATGF